MRAWGRGVTWWARTAQKSGSRLLPNAAVPVWLSSAFKEQPMATGKIGRFGAPCQMRSLALALGDLCVCVIGGSSTFWRFLTLM